MTGFRLFAFDDDQARGWLPFALTRPVGEMLFGTETLRARAERTLGRACEGHLTRSALAGFEEPDAPPCVDGGEIGGEGGRLLLSSRFVPGEARDFGDRLLRRLGDQPAVLAAAPAHDGRTPLSSTVAADGGADPTPDGGTTGGSPPSDLPAGAWLPPGTPVPSQLCAGRYPDWATVLVEGRLLRSPWELIDANAERIRADAERFADCDLPASVHRLGQHRIALGDGATLEPGVVLDAAAGPIVLEAGVQVRAHSRIAGPFYAGAGTVVLGGSLSASSLGPCCRVRGEVESSVALGYVNKAHDGFLGRSIVGRWANLGAMTTNSDLKNSYGLVRAQLRDRTVETGLLKAGCLLGDHVKTAIGTLLTTGSVVEAGSSLLGGGLAPRYVPPFCWGAGSGGAEYDIERFLATAERVMARRGVELADGMRELYRRAFAETAGLRGEAAAAVRPATATTAGPEAATGGDPAAATSGDPATATVADPAAATSGRTEATAAGLPTAGSPPD